MEGNKAITKTVLLWWRNLQPDPTKNRAGDRAALAHLRRCRNVTEALFEPAVQELVHQCHAQHENELARLALVSAVLAHVREDLPGKSLAREIGPKDSATVLCKPVRFRRLLDATSYDECLRAFRRLVALADRKVNVASLVMALLDWPREGRTNMDASDKIRRRWVYEYWNAGTLDAASDNSK